MHSFHLNESALSGEGVGVLNAEACYEYCCTWKWNVYTQNLYVTDVLKMFCGALKMTRMC